MSDERNARGWDAIASRYQSERGWPMDELVWGHRVPPERELQVLGNVHGRRVMVLGCGGGQDCVAVANMGASEVVGVDLSAEQIAHAERLCRARNVGVELRRSSV